MKLLYSMFFALTLSQLAYSQKAFQLSGKNSHVAIFPEELVNDLLVGSGNKFTPQQSDVLAIEHQLAIQIKEINAPAINQGFGKCPVIHKKLKHYRRQYMGYVNGNGEHIIFINAFYNRKRENVSWLLELVQPLDGCSFYWSIEYNLEKGKFENFQVNGIA